MENIEKIYPFTAIVGQEDMKKALILNVINPSLGGVLIRGEKGTAKSTAVRALAELLPEKLQVEGCVFGCNPKDLSILCPNCAEKIKKGEKLKNTMSKMKVINLPVSATEDRVVGTIDIEYAIKKGEKKFEPGLLAQANRNILYVDEINLLDDHIVDLLLDAAAMGINSVEREGISFIHPSKFVLVGTMNPEEGDLRPQLLDRFGMVVDIIGERDIRNRIEITKRRIDFERDKDAFIKAFDEEQNKLKEKILKAQEILNFVTYDDKILELSAKICIEMQVDGHRADVSMIKTAMTIAAYNGRMKIDNSDILEAAKLVLPHRMRKKPFEEVAMDFEKIEKILKE
ncbi:MAG: AAA family ATPase [Caloramator sp.]|nr:AAA family ATPase [Caloramator sp.]